MRHSICIIPARTGGHDWSVIAETGGIATTGHSEDRRSAQKESWKACSAADASTAGELVAEATPARGHDARSLLLSAPTSAGYLPSTRWLGATQATSQIRSAS